jgi:hypothetical protein
LFYILFKYSVVLVIHCITIKDHAQTQGLSEKFGGPGLIFLSGALFFPENVGEQGGGGGGFFSDIKKGSN